MSTVSEAIEKAGVVAFEEARIRVRSLPIDAEQQVVGIEVLRLKERVPDPAPGSGSLFSSRWPNSPQDRRLSSS
jgi:hypothetical protein